MCFHDGLLRSGPPCTVSLDFLVWLKKEWNTSKTKFQRSKAGIPSMRKPASREIIPNCVELCETKDCFLHIQLFGTNVSPENAQNSSRCWFWVFEISCKIRVVKQSQPALLCCVSHIRILLVFTRVVYVKNQTSQAFVTSFGPFCNCSCKFLYKP